MEEAWCLHENDVLNMSQYDVWKDTFVKEYEGYYKKWMEEHPMMRQNPEGVTM